ncbi:MAG: exosortase O [Xenococcaceae cyanobacterium MO_167.B52]|nr:exosortase O [Xenococcaceae cyanobacterium MO_167.B52]
MISKPIFKQENYFQTVLLITAWILGNTWTFWWFFKSLRDASLLNIIILGIAVIALSVQLFSKGLLKIESAMPRYRLYPLLLMLGGEIGAILLKWCISIPQLILLCFILGSYGLLGLFISYHTWHKGLTVAVIAACLIPFSIAFNSGLGFPVRVLTAHTVAQTLSYFHLSAVSSHDIIVMENGIAQIDLPCSGMKSLWTGTVFLLGVTWLEKRQLGFRWLLVALANITFLVMVNVIRVFSLVVLIEVLQQKQIAEVLHLPLGIIGFIVASGLTWLLLQKVPRYNQKSSVIQETEYKQIKLSSNWLLGIVVILSLVGQLNFNQAKIAEIKSIVLPQEIATNTLPLTATEASFFNKQNTSFVEKLRFDSNSLSGSMLIVKTDTWQAHHPPELCLMGSGLKIDKMNSKLINDSINARWLSLQDGKLSATYWFQSYDVTTDDFISRIWEHISHRNKTWVLVSVLFDDWENPDSGEVKDFTNTIYETINQSLNI